MRSASGTEELAAVVADGRPFDWSAGGRVESQPTLTALWHAVRHVEGARPWQPPDRARLTAPLVWLTAVALTKAAVTAGFVVLTMHAVDAAQVVTLATFTAVGGALLYGGHRDLRARRLGVVLVLLGSVMTKPLLRQVSDAWADRQPSIAMLQAVVVEAWLPMTLWMFVKVFPEALWSPRDAKLLRAGLVLSALLGLALFASNLLLAWGIDTPLLQQLSRDSTATPYFWPLMVAAIVPALLFMMWRRRDAVADERAKVTAFVAALVLALLPTLLIITLRFTPVAAWLLSHFTLTGVVMYSGLITLPLATGYAVLVHRVLRVELVLRNAARYALARGLLLAMAVGPLALLVLYAYQNRELSVGALFGATAGRALLTVSAVGAALLATRERIHRRLDRALRRDGVSLEHALDVFARRSGEGLGLGDVAEAMQRSVVAMFHPAVVAMFVADRARDAFVPLGASLPHLPRSTWLAQSVGAVREPVVVDLEDADGVARLLPASDQDWLADAGVVVLAPLMAGGGTVCGLIALGPMASSRSYGDDDLRLLGALASAAAPAIESRLLRPAGDVSRSLDDVRWDDESGRECPACGRAFAAEVNACAVCARSTTPMCIPRHLNGKFMVASRLGRGGMGLAYLAHDDALGRPVALKTLPRVRPEAVEQLRREARAMASVSHPALATIHGLESWRAVPVLVVEYLPGGTLADRLQRGPMQETEVLAIAGHVLGGLGRLHDAGLLHRDLKPSNIGFATDGLPKVLDFGLSRLRGTVPDGTELSGSPGDGVSIDAESAAEASSLVGTPAYMSPELVAGRPPSSGDDLWALAVVMLESLSGRHPWSELDTREVLCRLEAGESPILAVDQSRWSGPLRVALTRALSKDEGERPRTAAAFEQMFVGVLH